MTIPLLATLFLLQTPTTQSKSQEAKAQAEKLEAAAAAKTSKPTETSSRSLMMIEPKARANDYQKAFEILRQEKSTSKVFFELANGSTISNVIDMKLMPDNTLIVFRYSTPQGIKFQVIEIENLVGIRHP